MVKLSVFLLKRVTSFNGEEVGGMFDVYAVSAFLLLILFTTWLLFVRHPERYGRQPAEVQGRQYEQSVQLVEERATFERKTHM